MAGTCIFLLHIPDQKSLFEIQLHSKLNLHGIVEHKLGPRSEKLPKDDRQFITFGGNFIYFLTINLGKNQITLNKKLKLDREIWVKNVLPIDKFETLAIHTFQNQVLLLNLATQKIQVFTSASKCILYSSHLFFDDEQNLLRIYSGTVFNFIAVWAINLVTIGKTVKREIIDTSEDEQTYHGHNGAIFNLKTLNLDPKNPSTTPYFMSCSDDRSIKIWHPDQGIVSELYGHTARVWDMIHVSRSDQNLIISCSEDQQIIIFDISNLKQPKILSNFTAHHGRNVWCVSYDDETGNIFSGGEDGNLNVWNLDQKLAGRENLDQKLLNQSLKIQNFDIRCQNVHFLDQNRVGILNETGDGLVSLDLASGEKISDQSVTSLDDKKVTAWCHTQQGNFYGFADGQIDSPGNTQFLGRGAKILSLTADGSGCIYVSHELNKFSILWPNRYTPYLDKENEIVYDPQTLQTPLAHQKKCNWHLVAKKLDNSSSLLLVGDKNGTLHVYNHEIQDQDVSEKPQMFSQIHGKYGIYDIFVGQNGKILTCGSDNYVNVFKEKLGKKNF